MRLRATTLLLLAAACGSDSGTQPGTVDVRVVYLSRLPDGCPQQSDPCYPMCSHHNAPGGPQAIVTLWADGATVRLEATTTRRYEGQLTDVPVDTPLRLYGRDLGVCCVDACGYPPVLEDILLNGTKLTRVVRDGLPAGISGALEFRVTANGTILN